MVAADDDAVLAVSLGGAYGHNSQPPGHFRHCSRCRLVEEAAVREEADVTVVENDVHRVLYLPLCDTCLDVRVSADVDAVETEPRPRELGGGTKERGHSSSSVEVGRTAGRSRREEGELTHSFFQSPL